MCIRQVYAGVAVGARWGLPPLPSTSVGVGGMPREGKAKLGSRRQREGKMPGKVLGGREGLQRQREGEDPGEEREEGWDDYLGTQGKGEG